MGGMESHAANLAASLPHDVLSSVPEHMANSQVVSFLGELYTAMHFDTGSPELHDQVVQAAADLGEAPVPLCPPAVTTSRPCLELGSLGPCSFSSSDTP